MLHLRLPWASNERENFASTLQREDHSERKLQVADERRKLGRDLLFDSARRITRDG